MTLALLSLLLVLPGLPFHSGASAVRAGAHWTPFATNDPYVAGHEVFTFNGAMGSSPAALTVARGDAIVVFVAAHYATSVLSVSDFGRNSYQQAATVSSGSGSSLSVWVAGNASASNSLSVSVTLSRSAPTVVEIAAVTGASVTPIDSTGPGVKNSNSHDISASVTTIAAQDLVMMGIASTGTPTESPGGSLVLVDQKSSVAGNIAETGADFAVTEPNPGTFTLTARLSTTEAWAAEAIALRPGGGSGGPPPPHPYPVSGKVTDSHGVGLVGAIVAFRGPHSGSTTTLPNATYSVSLLNGTYTATASAVGFQNETLALTVAGTPVSGVNFILLAAALGNGSVQHVVVIYLENNPIRSVWAHGPYERYLALKYANASQFYATCHPSVSNYLAATSGATWQCGTDAYRVYSTTNIGDLLDARGLSWAGYFENMSRPCGVSNNVTYVTHHNPFVYYADIVNNPSRCDSHDLPASAWAKQVASGNLLNYSLYVPNNLNDAHNTSVAYADKWLRGFLSPLVNTTDSKLRSTIAHTVFFILYDESADWDNSGYGGMDGGHVYFVAVSPFSLGITYATDTTDYNLLSTIEWLFNLGSTGHNDKTSAFPAMQGLFSIP